ncbi:hypothetical protein [Streptomyces rapamycinicus]|uniref:Uncharacterized protein n=1 Tax=Streptomyces rapamycinicus TaxID=1226757 RepID=A0ABR6M224_9ACTN|nr:hypothetical protein [Streptomyces rapamycinicus]AGP60190.1 hypothetical protein M271_44110 [Streptomyces rapamycinicus NRRL 5491]MBB4788646.1 hypothetical protein [Streptomyces rapamycinicus]UTP35778.1 hypothetical protein LIV37_44875 [Streptomyces rapamycinicus NRRL 5491]
MRHHEPELTDFYAGLGFTRREYARSLFADPGQSAMAPLGPKAQAERAQAG